MPTKVSAGRMADAQPIAGEGLRADRAAYNPTPPPTMTARNGASCNSKLDPNLDLLAARKVAQRATEMIID